MPRLHLAEQVVELLRGRRQRPAPAPDEALKDTAVGGSYDFGVAWVSLAWRRFERATAKQDNLLVDAWIRVGSGEIKLSWNRADLCGTVGANRLDANDSSQIGIGYVHNLSRRSALYATMARIDNRGAAAYAIPGGPSGLAGGGRSTGTEAGFRHLF